MITAGATLAGALGAVKLTGNRDDRNRRTDIQRIAYAELVAAAQAALDYHEGREAMLPAQYDDRVRAESNKRTDELLSSLHQAIATVRMVGSERAKMHAKAIYDAAHGSVSSHLAISAEGETGWTYLATGAGPVYLQSAIDEFVEMASAELGHSRRRLILRWRPARRIRISNPAGQPPTARRHEA